MKLPRPAVVTSGVAAALVVVIHASDPPIVLVDATDEAGLTVVNLAGSPSKDYIVELNGNGVAFLDHDRDGDQDLLLTNGSSLERLAQGGDPLVALYDNDGDGAFTDISDARGLTARGWAVGTCVADYDNDGWPDVYVTAYGANTLYRNRGDGTFDDVTDAAGVGDQRWGSGCTFGDYDRDGDLDLYVANYLRFEASSVPDRMSGECRYQGIAVACGPVGLPAETDILYRNDGDGRFTDVTAPARVDGPGAYGFGVVFSDVTDDGWPDIFVANDSVANLLYVNQTDGTFLEESLVAGVALSATGREQAGMGVDVGDYDGDGTLDLIVTHFSGDYNTLYQNGATGFFSDVTNPAGLAQATMSYLGWGVGFGDLDHDGWLDLLVANGHVVPELETQGQALTYRQRTQLFRNQGDGTFLDVTDAVGGGLLVERTSRGAALGDYDNDGDLDAIVVNLHERPTLLRNDTVSDHHWLTLELRGTASNRDGVGTRVLVEAGGRTYVREARSGGSYLSHHDGRIHVGLGHAERVDRVELRWPSGQVDRHDALGADRFYRVTEGGSAEPLDPR